MVEAEFESRLLINKEEYDSLSQYLESNLKKVKDATQTNYYFDTKDFKISSEGNVLRIRVIRNTNKAVLTYKQKDVNQDTEYTQTLTSIVDINKFNKSPFFPDGEAIRILKEKGINTKELAYCGELTTYRKEYNDDNCLIVIDKNDYCGIIDYNLEVESSSRELAASKVKDLCQLFGINFNNDDQPKSKRAIDAFKKKTKL